MLLCGPALSFLIDLSQVITAVGVVGGNGKRYLGQEGRKNDIAGEEIEEAHRGDWMMRVGSGTTFSRLLEEDAKNGSS